MTQPKSLVVEALIYQRDGYFPESPFYEKFDKAIRIAEIEHRGMALLRIIQRDDEPMTTVLIEALDSIIAEYTEAVK
jgi:hypothetical protein